MRTELPDSAWESIGLGRVDGPDGVTYARARTRATRKDCERRLGSGSPLVLFWFGGRQLDWHDGDDAARAWTEVKKDVTTTQSTSGDVEWTAGIWTSEDGRSIVLLTGNC